MPGRSPRRQLDDLTAPALAVAPSGFAREVRDIAVALAQVVTQRDVAAVLVQRVADTIGAKSAGVWLREGEQATLAASTGYQEDAIASFGTVGADTPGSNPVSCVLATGEPVWIASRAELRAAFPGLDPEGSVGEVAVAAMPLGLDDRRVGVVAFSFDRLRPFDDADRSFFLDVAFFGGQALERARLFAAEQAARHEAEEVQQRLAFLGEATMLLASSLDYETTLDRVARLAVPRIADWCAVEICEPGQVIGKPVAVAHADPDKVAYAWALRERYPPNPDIPSGVPEVMRTGVAELYPEIPDELLVLSSQDEEHLRIARELGLVSAMIVPIQGRERRYGAITFAAATVGRRFGEADLDMAKHLAARAALAIDNAMLYQAERSVAARLEAVVAASPAALVLLDDDTTIRAWNPAAERLFGWSADEVLGRSLATLEAEGAPEALARFREVLVGDNLQGAEILVRTRHEASVAVSVWAAQVKLPDGKVQVASLFVDISDRKRAEASLTRSEAASRFLATSSAELTRSLELDDTLQRVAALAVPTLGEGAKVLAHADRDGEPDRVALAGLVTTAGPSLVIPLAARGRAIGALTILRASRPFDDDDLTLIESFAQRVALHVDNVRLLVALRKAVTLRDDFLSVASHELRTPIAALDLQLHSLVRRASTAAGPMSDWTDRLVQLRSQARRLTVLVDDLLDASRLGAGRFAIAPAPTDLAAVVREATDRFQAEAAAQEVELRIDAPSAIAGTWDGPRIDQIVTNLVANALKYGARAPVDVVVRREGEEVEVSVRDRGIGIAAQDRGRIFERFERAASSRNYGGLGLGLWIAQEIARAHGGRIEVVSEPGAGSTFTLHLPISATRSHADG